MLAAPGVRRRRLRARRPPRARRSARWCSATTTTASWSMPAGSAPASPRRWPTDLYRRLERSARRPARSRSASAAEAARQVRYVKPQLVAEVEFRGWTADSILRHAVVPGPARGQGRQRDRPRDSGRAGRDAGRRAPRSSSPIPTGSTGRTPASPRRAWPTTTPRSGGAWRRSSSAGRCRWCAARRASQASASSRSMPGRG